MAATLEELRNRVYGYLNDLQSPTAFTGQGDRYPAYIVNSTLNDAIRHYVKLLNSNYQGYLSAEVSIDLLASVNEYALPSAFRSVVYDVRRTINNVDYPLTQCESYLYPVDLTPVPNESYLPAYALRGPNIWFNQFPVSPETGAIVIRFQEKVAPLVADGDELPDQLYDMEDCVVIRTVVRLLQAKDVTGALKSVTGWKEEMRDVETAFWTQVANRYIRPDRPAPIAYSDELYI